MNDGGDCRTAPATMGLLNTGLSQQIFVIDWNKLSDKINHISEMVKFIKTLLVNKWNQFIIG